MKKSLFAIFLLAATFSCKKEETQPKSTTPTPTPGPTITKRFGYGLSGQPPGNVFVNDENYQAVSPEGGSNEAYIHHHVPYKFEVGKKYLLCFQKVTGAFPGTLYEYKADVKFDEAGAMTELNVLANSAHWKDSTLQSGESIIYFFIP